MKKMIALLLLLLIFFPFTFQNTVEAEKIDQDRERIQTELTNIQKELAKIQTREHLTDNSLKKDLVPPGTFVVSSLSTPRNPKPTPMLLPNVKPGEAKPKLIPIEPIEHIYKWLTKGQ
jgi:hypothetical protein